MSKTFGQIILDAIADFVDNVLTGFAWGIGLLLVYLLVSATNIAFGN